MKTRVLIPARMASTRLPGKMLALISGVPLVVHAARRAREADIGPAIVATDTLEIATAVRDYGFEAVMTRVEHASGSDRIFEALNQIDPAGEVECIVNVQGDLPTIDPKAIRASVLPLSDAQVDISTLVAPITRKEERDNSNVVKLVGTHVEANRLRALYFTRATAPWGDGPLYHHIGLYAYKRKSLCRFVQLPASTLELREKLEQLRAIEAGMRIDAMIVDTVPFGVDEREDLERARQLLNETNA